ncbi:MAG: class I SAM-dependent methyltransferase [Deltaproteobacteria bacterium]|nr:class I SAM-dependent methyltransferase [Deltaproteobacteria bacterium]
MIVDRGIVAGNVTDKYHSRNPIARWLMDGFLHCVGSLYDRLEAHTVLEVGCGEGELCAHLSRRRPAEFFGVDYSPAILEEARRRHPWLRLSAQSGSELAFPDKSFDLVVACEVLEHLPDPRLALAEIARVSRRFALLSVPREPLWRALNVARGAYVRDLGNTPGHLQHWSQAAFVRFVSSRMTVREVRAPLPWTALVAEVPA